MRPYRGLTEVKWVYGWYAVIEGIHFIIELEAECKWAEDHYEIIGISEVIPETVGQSIGKRDKNNEELFLDDIVKVHYEDILGYYYEAIGVLDLDDCGIVIDFPQYGVTVPMYEFYTDEPDDFEKLGNIHSNPDLLKEDKE